MISSLLSTSASSSSSSTLKQQQQQSICSFHREVEVSTSTPCKSSLLSSLQSSSSSFSHSNYKYNYRGNKLLKSTTSSSSSSSLFTYFIRIILFIFILYSYTCSADVLSDPRELESLRWLINQYGMGSPLDSTACNNKEYPYFQCSMTKTGYHITQIEYGDNNQIFQVNINQSLNELYFPELRSLFLTTDPFQDPSKNILYYLQNMPSLVDLRIRNQMRLTTIPEKFPFESKSLEIFRFTNNAAKEISNFNATYYPKLKDFEFSTISSIPNDFGKGMTSKMTINVKSGNNLAPDSLCNVKNLYVQSYYPGFTGGYVADCFLCYLNLAPVYIHPQPVVPQDFNCSTRVTVTGIRYTTSKITIYGSNLGWAVQGDVDYLLNAIVPNSVLEYGANPLSPKYVASGEDHPLAKISPDRENFQLYLSGSKGIKISIPLHSINIEEVGIRQESFGISVDIEIFFNPSINHTFLIDGQKFCSDNPTPSNDNIITCHLSILPKNGQIFNITISNEYHVSTYMATFTLEFPIVTVTNHISPQGGILELYGYFGSNRLYKSLTIQVNYVCCALMKMTETELRCRLPSDTETEQKLVPGRANLIVSIDGYEFQSNELLSISSNVDTDSEFRGIEDYDTYTMNNMNNNGAATANNQNNINNNNNNNDNNNNNNNNDNGHQSSLLAILKGASGSSLTILFSEFLIIVLLIIYIVYNRTRISTGRYTEVDDYVHHNKKQERSMV